MIPATATWLDAMIKAMSQVVIPAVNASDAVAIEQARLVLHHLNMLRLQHPHILHYQQQQVSDAHTLASRLAGLLRECGGDDDLVREADALLAARAALSDARLPSLSALEDAAVMLKAMANRVAERVLELAPAQAPRVNQLVLEWGEPTVLRERAWLNAADRNPELPALDALFGESPRNGN